MSAKIHLIRKAFAGGLSNLQGNQSQLMRNAMQESQFTSAVSYRYLPEQMKRFYRDATVEKSETGGYEVHLDRKPLKTPTKKNLKIHNEKLASAVAVEWSTQKNVIRPNIMHLTALCNTTQDNPLKREKLDHVDQILNNLLMDTILYRAGEDDTQDEKLLTLQRQKWDPIIDWFQNEFRVPLPISTTIMAPPIPQETTEALRNFLKDCSLEAIEGFHFGSDAIKSVVLTVATVLDRLTPKEAVHLSRLETEFQAEHWGVVEWHHEVELFDSIARLSAASLFFDFHHPYAQPQG